MTSAFRDSTAFGKNGPQTDVGDLVRQPQAAEISDRRIKTDKPDEGAADLAPFMPGAAMLNGAWQPRSKSVLLFHHMRAPATGPGSGF